MRVNDRGRNCFNPVLSGLFVFFGIALLYFNKKISDAIIDEILVIKPDNYLFKEWKDPSIELSVDIYYFNWTNPEDLRNSSVKPKFKEIGPVIFDETVHKCNITFHENNTVSYRNYKLLYYNKEKSGARYDENITTLNAVPVMASEKSRSWNFLYQKALSIAVREVPDYTTATAGEWLFDGFDDPLLSLTQYLPFLDDVPNMDKFAWFYQRNGSYTYEGFYNIGTGLGNTTFGQTYEWNFRNRSDYSGHCGELSAPTEVYPQNIPKDKIELFFPDFCRKIVLDYNETIVWHGIEAYRFMADISFLDNGKYHPENTCLCNRKCLAFGVIDYSKCKFGIPAYLSLPHFNKADPKYRNDIEGMEPDDERHRMQIIVNPRTGAVLETKVAMQMNLYLERNPSISKFQDVPEVMFPMFWFCVNVRINMRNFLLISLLVRLEPIFKIVSFVLIVLGLVLQVRLFYSSLDKRKKKECDNGKRDHDNLNLLTHKSCCDKT